MEACLNVPLASATSPVRWDDWSVPLHGCPCRVGGNAWGAGLPPLR